MKAIILASGTGKRLTPLTEKMPKCLIEIGGFTILERIISSLIEHNIIDIIITTGHFGDRVKKFVINKYGDKINATYVNNPIYDKTNYIYSLWLTREFLDDSDITLLHSDLVYDSKLIKRVVDEDKSCVLIKRQGALSKKDFKARIKDGLIKEIGVNVFGDDARSCMPVYRFLRSDFERLLTEIEEFIKNNKLNSYAEDAFNKISDEIKLYPAYYDEEFCMEVDDFNDLEIAKNFLN
ncbi:MAG: sugar phosphate nucleotidyltransferase [Patescibacteria group bacterium]|nr:sugar phosphate nucleotidyltransferase [Patescibacteria group bacterium]